MCSISSYMPLQRLLESKPFTLSSYQKVEYLRLPIPDALAGISGDL